MRARGWLLLFILAAAQVAACGTLLGIGDVPSPVDGGKIDSASDVVEETAADASRAVDAEAATDSGVDAFVQDTSSGDGCAPDLPDGGNFLVSSGVLIQLTGAGSGVYTVPGVNSTGVAFDRRATDWSFWVTHDTSTQPMFYKLDADSGAVTATLDYPNVGPSGIRGLDYALGATPQQDALVFVQDTGSGLAVEGASLSTGARMFSYPLPGTGFWGVTVAGSLPNATFWVTQESPPELQAWAFPATTPTTTLPIFATTGGLRGAVSGVANDFYLIDTDRSLVLRVCADGASTVLFQNGVLNPLGIGFLE